MAKGFLVSKEWVRGVEEALRTLGASQLEKGQAVSGLFYELRPAVLASSWTQNAAGLYVATAQFVVNDTVDSSFTFDVCAPTAPDDPGGTVGATRFFVVWRGRWEMVAGAGKMTGADILDQLQITSASTVTNVTATSNVIAIPTAATVAVPALDSVLLALDDAQTSGAVGVVTDIMSVAGAIGIEKKYLSAAATTTQQTVNATLSTTNKSVVTSMKSTAANRVASISARS